MIGCIAGMHRSGTSLMAQWLAQAGLPLTVGGTIAPDISNPHGYYEDPDFVRLHAAHLRGLRRRSFGWNYAPADFLHFDAGEQARAQAMIAARHALHPGWGWKDPRATLFLPDWKKLLPPLKVIIVWRPCAEVVSSLVTRGFRQRRHHLLIGPVQAIRLWKAHNRLACDYQARFPDDTLVVDACQLPDTWKVVHQQLTTQLGLSLSPVPVNQLFDPKLLHRQNSGWLQRLCVLLGSGPIASRLRVLSVGGD